MAQTPMRIGVNALFLIPGEVGGTETYVREMLRSFALAEHDQLTVFCNRENLASFATRDGRVETVSCPISARFRPGRILYEQVGLPRVVARAHVDVLWSPGYTSPFRSPCPSVVTIHDLQFRHHREDFSRAERMAQRCLVRLSCARAAHVLTAATISAEEIIEFGGVPADRITVAPYGVSAEFFERIDAARAEDSLAQAGVTRPFLLTVASSYPHKNLARLARSFGRLEDDLAHELVIVGHAGRGEAAFEEARRHLKNPSRVRRLSGLSRDALRALYETADLLVAPTLFEGFGLPVIEAMAAGTPVVCSDIPVLHEVAGGAAEFFDPESEAEIANAVRRLLRDDRRRAELRRRGVAHAREFTWERTARRTREVFARVTDRRA